MGLIQIRKYHTLVLKNSEAQQSINLHDKMSRQNLEDDVELPLVAE